MSCKSHPTSKPTSENRKTSWNLYQAATRDSLEMAASCDGQHSLWQKDAESIQTESGSKLSGKDSHLLSIQLYSQKYEVDCSDVASVRRFMDELKRTDSIKNATKVALSLMVAQRVQELKVNCEDFVNCALENYESAQYALIFN